MGNEKNGALHMPMNHGKYARRMQVQDGFTYSIPRDRKLLDVW